MWGAISTGLKISHPNRVGLKFSSCYTMNWARAKSETHGSLFFPFFFPTFSKASLESSLCLNVCGCLQVCKCVFAWAQNCKAHSVSQQQRPLWNWPTQHARRKRRGSPCEKLKSESVACRALVCVKEFILDNGLFHALCWTQAELWAVGPFFLLGETQIERRYGHTIFTHRHDL